MGRGVQIGCVLLLMVGAICLLPGAGSMAAEGPRAEQRHSGVQVSQSHPRRDCSKRKGHAKPGRRHCRQKKQRRRAPAAAIPEPVAGAPSPPASPTAAMSQEIAPEPNGHAEPEVPKEGPPKEKSPLPLPIPRCELVPSPCSIYSDKFWELLAKYKRFEIGTGVYPYPPECMEAQEAGLPVGCLTVIAVLRPDGTIGGGWMIDPCAPNGWRNWEPDPPPCPPEEAPES